MKITRTGLDAAIIMIDEKIPEELKPYWETVKQFINELPEETLIKLLQSISNQLVEKKQCLIIEEGDDLRIFKDIEVVLIKDLK